MLSYWSRTLCPHKGCNARTFGQYARKMSDVRTLFQALHTHVMHDKKKPSSYSFKMFKHNVHLISNTSSLCTVESPTTDSPYYGNLHNANKIPRSQIIPIVYCILWPPYSRNLPTPIRQFLHKARGMQACSKYIWSTFLLCITPILHIFLWRSWPAWICMPRALLSPMQWQWISVKNTIFYVPRASCLIFWLIK